MIRRPRLLAGTGADDLAPAERELVELAAVSDRLHERAERLTAMRDEMRLGVTSPGTVRRELRRIERERLAFRKRRDLFALRHDDYLRSQLSTDEIRAFMET